MTVVPADSLNGTPRRASAARAARVSMIAASVTVMFRKPGPETSISFSTSLAGIASTTFVASSRGLPLSCLASARMPLAWKSARSLRRSSGSADAASGRAAERPSARRCCTVEAREGTEAMSFRSC
ncbi:hypothetical protein STANM309S_01415 [Streptomyces tanashiensis]